MERDRVEQRVRGGRAPSHSFVGSGPESTTSSPNRNRLPRGGRQWRSAGSSPATGVEDQTFENPKTGAVLETAFVYQDGTKGTDLYLSVTSRDTVPPNPYRR